MAPPESSSRAIFQPCALSLSLSLSLHKLSDRVAIVELCEEIRAVGEVVPDPAKQADG
jgi:hypothetical protein